jgi:hypothetical protein
LPNELLSYFDVLNSAKMLETTLLGPISAVYVLGISSILVPLAASCPLILYILTDVSSEIGLADVISAASATGLVGSYIVMLLYMTCYRSYESYFTSTPWLEAADSNRQIVGNRSYQKRCPFTGNEFLHSADRYALRTALT